MRASLARNRTLSTTWLSLSTPCARAWQNCRSRCHPLCVQYRTQPRDFSGLTGVRRQSLPIFSRTAWSTSHDLPAFLIRSFTSDATLYDSGQRHDRESDVADTARVVNEPTPLRSRPLVIRLSKREIKVCRILDQTARHYESSKGQRLCPRLVGGWVRDKLLGLVCNDMDVAVESMMGYEFASLVNNELTSRGQDTKAIAKIAINREKAKYLETATMVLHGVPMDFANLRPGHYGELGGVSNDQVFGSPYEDAYHRDFTINALFYNIRTDSVEDYTGKGLDDLRNGVIRTPLRAYETFWQDPLRVIRCIRFAAGFHFQIAEDTKQAMLDPRIKEALRTKISPERVGAELNKIIRDRRGRPEAMRLLREIGLFDEVIRQPVTSVLVRGVSEIKGTRSDTEDAFKLAWIMEWLTRINGDVSGSGAEVHNDALFQPELDAGRESLLKQTQDTSIASHLYPLLTEEPLPNIPRHSAPKPDVYPYRISEQNLIYGSMLYPYRNVIVTHNNKQMPASSWIYKHCLKRRSIDIHVIDTFYQHIDSVRMLVDSLAKKPPLDNTQQLKSETLEIGTWIRQVSGLQAVSQRWPCIAMFGLGVDLLPKFELLKQGILDEASKATIAKYNTLLSRAQSYQISDCFSWRHIIDDSELMKTYGILAGPQVSLLLREMMRWQLQHPTSSKDECLAWLVARHPPTLFK